jgi:hypothetical protein
LSLYGLVLTSVSFSWGCSTGWLTHWGEVMANTSTAPLLTTLNGILEYANGTGSINFYMAHGGTNFGYWAGKNLPLTHQSLGTVSLFLSQLSLQIARLLVVSVQRQEGLGKVFTRWSRYTPCPWSRIVYLLLEQSFIPTTLGSCEN